jgi:hypothetical protein
MKHFILFKDVKNKKLVDVFSLINRSKKIKIENIKLIDMIYMKQSLIGVYIFFNLENQPIYVGKCSSRSFLERIASHYDLRVTGIMNNFLCALADKPKGRNCKKIKLKELQNAYLKSLKYKLLFIELPLYFRDRILQYENLFISKYKETLINKEKKFYKNYNESILFKNI